MHTILTNCRLIDVVAGVSVPSTTLIIEGNRIIDVCGGNQTRAAEMLDIDRVTLHNKLKKYGWKKSLVENP